MHMYTSDTHLFLLHRLGVRVSVHAACLHSFVIISRIHHIGLCMRTCAGKTSQRREIIIYSKFVKILNDCFVVPLHNRIQ
jgi:hypothetical protein